MWLFGAANNIQSGTVDSIKSGIDIVADCDLRGFESGYLSVDVCSFYYDRVARRPGGRKTCVFIGKSGAPKGTILELFSTPSWQVCRRSSSMLDQACSMNPS